MMLALDYGSRYIGVAATDYEGRIPFRHSTIDQKQQKALEVIPGIVAKERIKKILVGLPVNLEGGYTQQTGISQAFIQRLRTVVPEDVEIIAVDETLTSVEAEKRIAFEGGDIAAAHSEAARILLEDYLNT
jgi:putative Holliday junction resolvase